MRYGGLRGKSFLAVLREYSLVLAVGRDHVGVSSIENINIVDLLRITQQLVVRHFLQRLCMALGLRFSSISGFFGITREIYFMVLMVLVRVVVRPRMQSLEATVGNLVRLHLPQILNLLERNGVELVDIVDFLVENAEIVVIHSLRIALIRSLIVGLELELFQLRLYFEAGQHFLHFIVALRYVDVEPLVGVWDPSSA